MQSINVVVINPIFLGTFFGTAVLGLVLAIAGVVDWQEPGAIYLIAGGVLYLVGTILVTIAGNVPLNNALAAVTPESAEGATVWGRYLKRWTAWNHVRTAAALAACGCFILTLARAGWDTSH